MFKVGDEVVAVYNPNHSGIIIELLLYHAAVKFPNIVKHINYLDLRHTEKQVFNNDFEDKLNGS